MGFIKQKWTLFVVLVISFSFSAIGFSFKFRTPEETATKMKQIEGALQDIKAAIEVEKRKQQNVDKIIKIINQYNPGMPAELKYRIAEEIYTMSLRYSNLDIDFICATITHESAATWDPRIISRAGAMGLMQIMPSTGRILAEYEGIAWTTPEEILFNPIYNIRMGCRYLSTLIQHYGIEGGLAAYNGGERKVLLWLANNKNYNILQQETRDYIPAILELYRRFKD